MARTLAPGNYAALIAALSLLAILSSPSAIIANLSARTVRDVLVSRVGCAFSTLACPRVDLAGFRFGGVVADIRCAVMADRRSPIHRIHVGGSFGRRSPLRRRCCPLFLAGMLQGARSFALYGAFGAFGAGARLGVGILLVGLGFGAAGAVASTPVSGFLAIAAGYAGWRWLMRGRSSDGENDLTIQLPIRGQLQVAAIGAVQILLFNLDILFVKALFDEQGAADYAAAALIGRTIFFAASPLATVLLPNVVSQHRERRELTRHLLIQPRCCRRTMPGWRLDSVPGSRSGLQARIRRRLPTLFRRIASLRAIRLPAFHHSASRHVSYRRLESENLVADVRPSAAAGRQLRNIQRHARPNRLGNDGQSDCLHPLRRLGNVQVRGRKSRPQFGPGHRSLESRRSEAPPAMKRSHNAQGSSALNTPNNAQADEPGKQ